MRTRALCHDHWRCASLQMGCRQHGDSFPEHMHRCPCLVPRAAPRGCAPTVSHSMLPTRYRLLAAAGGGAHSTHIADGPRARQQQRSPSPDAHRSHLTCHSQISLHRLPHTPVGRQTQRKAPRLRHHPSWRSLPPDDHHCSWPRSWQLQLPVAPQSPRDLFRRIRATCGPYCTIWPKKSHPCPEWRHGAKAASPGPQRQCVTQSSEIGQALETPVWSVAQGKKKAWREEASKLRRSRSPSANRPAQLAGPTHPLLSRDPPTPSALPLEPPRCPPGSSSSAIASTCCVKMSRR